MSRKQTPTLAEAWTALVTQANEGRPMPKQRPTYLNLQQIKLRPEVFQHRKPPKHASEAHIRELIAVRKRGDLEPLLVWWDGKHWTCIDGHHRLAAHRKVNAAEPVLVEVFEGTPDEALQEAAVRNTQAKLQMSSTEKLNAAWRIVVTTGASKAATVKASGASDGTVAQMRRVKEALAQRGVSAIDHGWQEARRLAAGEGPSEAIDWDEQTEKEAKEMANKLLAALGKRAGSRVDAFARALEIYDTRLPAMLREVWGELDEDELEADE